MPDVAAEAAAAALQELRRYTGIEPLLSADEAKDELCDSLADAMAAATLREQ